MNAVDCQQQEDTLSLARELAAFGFASAGKSCAPDVVAGLLHRSLERIARVQTALGGRPIGIGSAAGFDEIVQRSPGRWDVPISPAQLGVDDRELPWWPLVAATLGPDAEHSFSGVVFSDPGAPAQEWHIDSPHESAKHLPPHALNVLVALQDVTMAMGPTEIAVSSHRLTNHLSNQSLQRDELVYQHATSSPAMLVSNSEGPIPASSVDAMPAGKWILFDDRLMHRGLANESKVTRYMAYFSYRSKGYAGNTHFEAQRSVFD